MKHKKLFIIMAIVAIMATFTISTFAQVPTEAVTGYYLYGGTDLYQPINYQGNAEQTYSLTYSEFPNNNTIVSFIVYENDFYFPSEYTEHNSDYLRIIAESDNEQREFVIDIIDNLITTTGAKFYWSLDIKNALTSAEFEELIYEPNTTTNNNIYADIYGMVHQYIFGGAELSVNQDFVATLTATWSCILLVMLPFIIVWGVFKLFVR